MNTVGMNNYISLIEPVREVHEIFNSKWKPLIIISILSGNSKFRQIERSIPNISSKVLLKKLRELEESAIVQRKVYKPHHVTYTIEHNNQELEKVIAAYKDLGLAMGRH